MNLVHKAYELITTMWRRPVKQGDSWWYGVNSHNVWNDIDYIKSFNCVPELNAIIGMKARMFSNGILKMVNDKGEQVKHPLSDLMKKPNWFQSQKEFLRQTKLFHEIHGNEYIYGLFPVGFNIDRVKAIFTLPPALIRPEYLENAPFYTFAETPNIKYILDYDGSRTEIDKESILHLNNNRVSIEKTNDKYILIGESNMKALTPAINNIKMAYETRGVILKYRGALGILSNAGVESGVSIPLTKEEKQDVQDQYKNYGGLTNQQSLIITSANLKWQQMSINPDKLGLYQETEEDFFKMCDSYGTPIELFVRRNGATYENKKQAQKDCYINTVIPEACEWIDGFNTKYLPADSKVKFVMDFSHLAIFQEDLKFRGEALEKMVNALSKLLADGAITIEEYKEELIKFGFATKK